MDLNNITLAPSCLLCIDQTRNAQVWTSVSYIWTGRHLQKAACGLGYFSVCVFVKLRLGR